MKKLWRFNIDTSKLQKTNVEIPESSRILQINNRIFMTGGYEQFKQTKEFIESIEVFQVLPEMINGRYFHCMLSSNYKAFCVIGGYNGKNSIKECEQYDIQEKEWTLLPSLNDGLACHSGIRIANRCIYIFGGERNGKNCSVIEFLCLKKLDVWEILNLRVNECDESRAPLLIELSSNEILIFKGYGTNESYIFNPSTISIKKNESLFLIPDYFSQILLMKSTIYAIGVSGNIHTFNPGTDTYTGIAYSIAIQCKL